VWPFEKHQDGSTLYCKRVNFGALPNNGTKTVAHNITGLVPETDVHSAYVQHVANGTHTIQYPGVLHRDVLFSTVRIWTNTNRSTHSAHFLLIYDLSSR
jgi:hypothetical protein